MRWKTSKKATRSPPWSSTPNTWRFFASSGRSTEAKHRNIRFSPNVLPALLWRIDHLKSIQENVVNNEFKTLNRENHYFMGILVNLNVASMKSWMDDKNQMWHVADIWLSTIKFWWFGKFEINCSSEEFHGSFEIVQFSQIGSSSLMFLSFFQCVVSEF